MSTTYKHHRRSHEKKTSSVRPYWPTKQLTRKKRTITKRKTYNYRLAQGET